MHYSQVNTELTNMKSIWLKFEYESVVTLIIILARQFWIHCQYVKTNSKDNPKQGITVVNLTTNYSISNHKSSILCDILSLQVPT